MGKWTITPDAKSPSYGTAICDEQGAQKLECSITVPDPCLVCKDWRSGKAEFRPHFSASPTARKLLCAAAAIKVYREALEAAHAIFGQQNLLSTASDEERRACIQRAANWWNNVARKALADGGKP